MLVCKLFLGQKSFSHVCGWMQVRMSRLTTSVVAERRRGSTVGHVSSDFTKDGFGTECSLIGLAWQRKMHWRCLLVSTGGGGTASHVQFCQKR